MRDRRTHPRAWRQRVRHDDGVLGCTRLQERPGVHPSELAMVEDLCDDHEVLLRSLQGSLAGMQASISILAQPTFSPGAMQEHAKMAWMLRSVLGNQANLKEMAGRAG